MNLLRSSARIRTAMRGNRLPETVFRMATGNAAGMCIAFTIFTGGGGTRAEVHYRTFSHPIINGFVLGIAISVPLGIAYYTWRRIRHSRAQRRGLPEPPFPRNIGRTAMFVSCLATLIFLNWIALKNG